MPPRPPHSFRPAPGADLSSPQGRMTPINHTGPLPWVQLRNATFHPSIFKKMIGRLAPNAKNGDLVCAHFGQRMW